MSWGVYESAEVSARLASKKKKWEKFSERDQRLNFKELKNVTVILDNEHVGGTKGRYLFEMLPNTYEEYVCVCDIFGSDQVTVAATVKLLCEKTGTNKNVTIFTKEYKKVNKDTLPYYTISKDYGALHKLYESHANVAKAASDYVNVSITYHFFVCVNMMMLGR